MDGAGRPLFEPVLFSIQYRSGIDSTREYFRFNIGNSVSRNIKQINDLGRFRARSGKRENQGYEEERRSQARLDRILVVEGYMDVVALAEHGVKTAVATLQTTVAGGDKAAVAKAVGATGKACKACHDEYKSKDYLY